MRTAGWGVEGPVHGARWWGRRPMQRCSCMQGNAACMGQHGGQSADSAHVWETRAARPAPRARVGQRECGPAAASLPGPLTLCAGQVPPEDDEYEYSEYSVEEYQDPEAAPAGAGESGGRPGRVWGQATDPSPSLTASGSADPLTPTGPRPLLASAGRGLLYGLHPALVPSGGSRWHRGLSPLCLWRLWRECQPFRDP